MVQTMYFVNEVSTSSTCSFMWVSHVSTMSGTEHAETQVNKMPSISPGFLFSVNSSDRVSVEYHEKIYRP